MAYATRPVVRAPAAMAARRRPPVVLGMADYYGTLAAVRALGRAGVEVTVADGRWLVPARWSRYASRTVACPAPESEPERFVEWLLALGARDPGQVLLATSDDVAWLLARHHGELSRTFRLQQPALPAMEALLDKWRLFQACRAVGLDAPDTWLPADVAEAARLAATLPFPLLVKPRTQVLLWPHQKGRIVRGPEALPALYSQFRAATRHAPLVLASDPDVGRPLLQAFVEGAAGVYGLSGWVDEDGRCIAVASRKLLQRPRMMGVGICFEEAEPAPALAARVGALCRHVGYHGPFEAEFVEAGGRRLLIDFNPRFYGQMAFEVARGLDLPYLAYLEAVDDRPALRAALDRAARATATAGTRVYCHRIQLEVFLRLMRITGRATAEDVRTWRGWWRSARERLTDPMIDPDDRVPALVEAASVLWQTARHPRAALRAAAER